ncbi:hypothetical protein DBL03_01240 [Pseudomonas putida]|nr:hypothetical protein DBL03_01240 [Pseudomonas putida]
MVILNRFKMLAQGAMLSLFGFMSCSVFASDCGLIKSVNNTEMTNYSASLSSKSLQRINEVTFDGEMAGRLVQSIALDSRKCTWVAAVSLSKNPSSVLLGEFGYSQPEGRYKLYQSDTLFSHPQDISASLWGDKTLFWLPSQDGVGVTGFTLNDGVIHEEFHFELFKRPIKGITTAVDGSGRYLAVQGGFAGEKGRKQMVRVYDLQQLMSRKETLSMKSVEPLYEWPLDDAQQDKKQWRQGMAIYGNNLFILSGNAKPSQKKLLINYRLDGEVISTEFLPENLLLGFKMQRSKTFEPEGLEVVSYNGNVGLAIGLAGGAKFKRSYELWFVPLRRDK